MKALRFLPFVSVLIMLVTGLVLMYCPPKKMNGVYGYRTDRSYSSQRNWDFAQQYSAKVMVVSSALILMICAAASYAEHRLAVGDVEALTVNAILAVVLSFVEIALVLGLTEWALSKM